MLRWILLAVWMFAPFAAPAWAQAPDAAWMMKTVHGYRFALALETVIDSSVPGDPRHARVMDHRIVVSIRDAASQRPLQGAAVSLDVAELGFRGSAAPMQPARGADAGAYEARVRLRRGAAHRVLVYATPEADGRTLEAQFEYQHHH